MDIVPVDEGLVIEARINPDDIDEVAAGQPAHVRLTAYSTRALFALNAQVLNVSADRLSDEQTGADYFLTRLQLTEPVPEGVSLYPGMQAEVMVVTGARTLLDYLTRPLLQSLNRAMRES